MSAVDAAAVVSGLPQAVLAAEARIRPYVLRTPLEPSLALSRATGASVLIKFENLQRTGSFKLRGALNKLLSLSEEDRARGIVTASSGNHGLAVAHAARAVGADAEVHVPSVASPAKLERIRQLGADLIVSGDDGLESELAARAAASQSGRVYVSPYNDLDVVAGQGTIGLELTDAASEPLDAVFVALGGGGLISGIAVVLKEAWPDVEVVACSPVASPVMMESVHRGRVVEMPSQPTLSDGTAGGVEPGAVTFPLCQTLVDRYVAVEEPDIASGMRHAVEVEHTLIEGSAALPIAGVLQEPERYAGKRVALVLCGANVSASTLASVLA